MHERASWAAYAKREGLIREDAPLPVLEVPARNKYGAVRVRVDGISFASKKEAGRFLELRLLEKAGAIAELVTQPVFPLHIQELWRSQAPIVVTQAGHYRADFSYIDLKTGEIVIEDVKGGDATRTTDYKLRKRIAELVHGIHVREV